MIARPLNERFWAKVDKRGPDECWPWTARCDDDGYGRISVGGINRKASRIGWELANGRPVPPGMIICHTCDNRQCVNPAHLWIGTHRDNVRDAMGKKRMWYSRLTHCVRGHEFTAENTAMRSGIRSGQRRCRACARLRANQVRDQQVSCGQAGDAR